jgi:hypothetical protein
MSPHGQIDRRVAIEEIEWPQLEAMPHNGHHGPIFPAHHVMHPDGVPQHDVGLLDAIRLRPCGQSLAWRTGNPVEIRLGRPRIGDVMIGAVNAEVFNPIAQRLKRESPYKATMMATLTNGAARSGYIPDDASFGSRRSKSCRRGCSRVVRSHRL